MRFKAVDWFSRALRFLFFSVTSLIIVWFRGFSGEVSRFGLVGGWVEIDFIGISLRILSLVLGLSLFSSLVGQGWWLSRFVFLSIVFSVCSFVRCHALVFWCFYELSIVSLLVLLIIESPYSERFLASWYLLSYVVLTGLPMLLLLAYFGMIRGRLKFKMWELGEILRRFDANLLLITLLGILFITKVPLPPFHTWLPIVHAEARRSVSVCLRGYVMKLGILGLCRFCSWVLPFKIFTGFYTVVFLSLTVLFFMAAISELDGKRWLAFLSLSHITIACLCLSIGGFGSLELSMLYCVGHGISAGLVFMLLWWFYDVCGSRSWLVVKNSVGGRLGFRVLCVGSLCTSASIPPTIQFFREVGILVDCSWTSLGFLALVCFYLFFGGLVPLFLVGYLLGRHIAYEYKFFQTGVLLISCLFLCLWRYILFLII